jgi:TusA-related sulfurtransferase
MKTVELDVRGHDCPIPSLKMMNAVVKKEVEPGDTLDVIADCDSFEDDVKKFCSTMKKVLLFIRDEGEHKRCQVRI